MKSLLIVTLFAVGAFASLLPSRDLDAYWDEYKTTYGKEHGNFFEETLRRSIWEANLKKITKHNQQFSLGKTTFQLAMNEFGDLTNAEFVAARTGLKQGQHELNISTSTFLAPAFLDLPKHVDWRKKGYVTPVKDQMDCGSCWAFSAVGSLEGQHFKKSGKLVSLSEQNLVDCSRAEGNKGCNGGSPFRAYNYIMKNKGIDTEKGYPYMGEKQQCQFMKSDIGATITGITWVKSMKEHSLQKAIASVGPISVCIDISHDSFQFYSSGVYNEPYCSSTDLDHCVTAVGYDATWQGNKYYIVKNSWGTNWGQEGYIWMSRDKKNQCGIATEAIYPLV